MAKWQYTKGLHDLGKGAYAYLVPDGSWGWSNSGLVVDGDDCLLVDTLFDVKCTREMLDVMHRSVPQSKSIGTLVNTHSNGDHTFGNELVKGAEIVSSKACYDEMVERTPAHLAELMRNAPNLGEGGKFLHEMMGPPKFDFEGIDYTLPTKTFDKETWLKVGSKDVHLINVGPAHTGGDTLVHIPEDRTVFTGDILFNEGHPVLWAGPVGNWIAACDLMLGWDLETVVPGHGPIADKSTIARFKEYLQYIDAEARKRYDAGMGVEEAAHDISLDGYKSWLDAERIVINVNTLYRDYSGQTDTGFDRIKLFAMMARYYKQHPHPHKH